MQTSAPHRWQLACEPRFVLFWWWTGSTALSGLKVHVLNKMLWPFTTSACTTRNKRFLAQARVLELQLAEEKHKVHHVLNKMLWPFTTSAHGAGTFWLQFLSSDSGGEGVIHSPACFSMKTTSWAGAFRTKLICVVMACTRMIYSRAGFGQRLLAWLTSEPKCTNSFCSNWSRLPLEGPLRRNLLHLRSSWVNLGRFLIPIKNYKTCANFDRTAWKSV